MHTYLFWKADMIQYKQCIHLNTTTTTTNLHERSASAVALVVLDSRCPCLWPWIPTSRTSVGTQWQEAKGGRYFDDFFRC